MGLNAWKPWMKENAAALTVLFAVISGTWHLSSTLATKREVREVREIVNEVKATALTTEAVAGFELAIDTANTTAESLNTAVEALNISIGALNTTTSTLTGTVRALRATTDALRFTMSPLVQCMVKLHTSYLDVPCGATVDVEAQLPPECREAIRESAPLGQ